MNRPFQADRIDEEKADPTESSSLRFINVPLLLVSMFLGFGVSYLWLQTDAVDFTKGDSRTVATEAPLPASDGEGLIEMGAALYKKNCQACHQPHGKGLANAFPPLDGSEWVTGDPETLGAILLHGVSGEIEVQGQTFKGVMPPFGEKLSEREIAALATYVRGSWSNKAGEVSPETVKRVAEATADRTTPWQGGVELKEQSWK